MSNKTIKQLSTEHTSLLADDWLIAQKDASGVTGKIRASNVFDGGYKPLSAAPDTVTALGNNSFQMVFNSVDYTSILSNGMRIRATRTAAAPNTAFSLDGSNDYYVKTSPNKLTFTDDFVCSAWVYLTSYPAAGATIVSRYNGTSGWSLYADSTGRIFLDGVNGGASNISRLISYQSIPLNRWVHVAAQLDMSAFTATTTTSYCMIDGVNVPVTVSRGGTNPTALIQAGNLEIGSTNGGTLPFPGYLDQVAVYSAKVTQATILASINRALTGSETSLASAYSNGSVNDLNTTTPNNLTATNGATTVASSPFGNRGVSTTLEYGVVMANTFSTNTTVTVQVPEGCQLPTTGGISSVDYSTQNVPYGFPRNRNRWVVGYYLISNLPSTTITASTTTTAYPSTVGYLNAPLGDWKISFMGWAEANTVGATTNFAVFGGLYNMTTSKLVGTILRSQNGASTNYTGITGTTSVFVSLSSATKFTFAVGAGWTTSGIWYGGNVGGTTGPTPSYTIEAENAYI